MTRHKDPQLNSVLDQVLGEFAGYDLVPEGFQASKTSHYVTRHRHEYTRTLHDLKDHFGALDGMRVFEIGAFFGVVSIALARLGCQVTASDLPDYMSLPEQQARFGRDTIAINAMRLEDYRIDQADASQDCVIMCEVLEHLNFNPLPLLKEINRILRPGGLFYLSLPNQARLHNRLRLLRGRSVGIPVADFYDQLDQNSPAIANGHWREYSMVDIDQLVLPLGFHTQRQYYFSLGETLRDGGVRKILGRLFYRLFPTLKENQTHLLIKSERTKMTFHIPSTVHKTLRRL